MCGLSCSGTVSFDELKHFGSSVKHSATWGNLIDTHVATSGGAEHVEPLTFDEFCKIFGRGGMEQVEPTQTERLKHVASSKATYDEKAKFIFDLLDSSEGGGGDGYAQPMATALQCPHSPSTVTTDHTLTTWALTACANATATSTPTSLRTCSCSTRYRRAMCRPS